MSEVSKTVLSFKGCMAFTELRKAIILMIMVYYSEKIQIKISKEKQHTDRIQEISSMSFYLSSPSRIAMLALNSPSNAV